MHKRRSTRAVIVALAASALLAGCSDADKTFAQAGQAAQHLANTQCDESGGIKGFPSYGGEGMGQIAEETFVCDNGKEFRIYLNDEGTYDYERAN